jgi:hypothetical protein
VAPRRDARDPKGEEAKLNGEMVNLWRVVDQEGEVLESFVAKVLSVGGTEICLEMIVKSNLRYLVGPNRRSKADFHSEALKFGLDLIGFAEGLELGKRLGIPGKSLSEQCHRQLGDFAVRHSQPRFIVAIAKEFARELANVMIIQLDRTIIRLFERDG